MRYTLFWGIHRGSLMSRDCCDKEDFNTKKEAIKYVKKNLKDLNTKYKNVYLWFANLTDNKKNKRELNIIDPVPYD